MPGAHDYVRSHRPYIGPPTNDAAGLIILWTYARSAKTFQGSVRLAGFGYGEQAGMLNRSLYEDMLIAHWVKRHPKEAANRLRDHDKYTLARWGAALGRHGLLQPGAQFPQLTKAERQSFGARFRGKTWTGLSLAELLADVRSEWSHPHDLRLLNQVNDLVHAWNNLLLHHSARGLAVAGRWDEDSKVMTFEVGPSTRHVHGALLGAFFAYANTPSLVEPEDSISEVYGSSMAAFVTEREAP